MAVSVTNVKTTRVPGAERTAVKTVTFDNSYAEGGESLTPGELGLTTVDYAVCTITHGSESAELRPASAFYTPSTEKIHLIDSATGKEVAGTKDMSKVTVQVVAFGS